MGAMLPDQMREYKMTRAKFTRIGRYGVELEYSDPVTESKITRQFFAHGRQVFEAVTFTGPERQVCEKLDNRGSTLELPPDGSLELIDLIRREYRAMRRRLLAELPPMLRQSLRN